MADDNPPDLQSVFAMPEFRQLDGVEKIKFLDHYPEFKQLPVKEKVSFIGRGLQEIHMKPRGAQSQPPGLWETTKAVGQVMFPRAEGFWRTVGEEATGMAQAAWQTVTHPIDALAREYGYRAGEAGRAVAALQQGRPGEAAKSAARSTLGPTGTAMAREQREQFRKGTAEAKAGEPVSAAGHYMAGALPIVGPAAAQAGEEINRGETGRGLAHAAMLLGPDVISAGLGLGERTMGAASRAALRSRLSPQQVARFAEAESRAQKAGFTGRMFTRGEEAGKPVIIRMERAAEATPGPGGPAGRMYAGRTAELGRQAEESIERVAPGSVPGLTIPDLGTDAKTEAGQSIRRMKTAADKVYDQVRAAAAKDTQRLKLGTRRYTLPNGQVISKDIYGVYEAPVALQTLRAGLKPLYNEFRTVFKDLTESERMANPGYASLHKIMNDIDPLTSRLRLYMGAMDLEKELGAIKKSLRDTRFSTFTFSPSGRVQLRVINNGEALVAKALDKAQPGTSALLDQGKRIVRQYSTADELVTSIIGRGVREDPGAIYRAMTRAKDYKFAQIQRLAQLAPNASAAIWRNYLEGALTDALGTAGRLDRGSGAKLTAALDKLGPKTRQVAFGAQLNKELDDVFRTIKEVNPQVGSTTFEKLAGFSAIGAAGEVLNLLFGGHPVWALGIAGKAAATAGALNLLARVWFSPGGAAATTRLLRAAKIGGAVMREAYRGFEARVTVAQDEQRKAQAEQEVARSQAEVTQPAGSPAPIPPAPAPHPPPAPPQRRPSPFAKVTPQKFTPAMENTFQSANQAHSLPRGMLRAMASVESAGDPQAVSNKGAIGLMQFMPGVAEQWGGKAEDPISAINAAGRYMAWLGKQYGGDWRLALAAYNAGPAKVGRAVPSYAKDYVDAVFAHMGTR